MKEILMSIRPQWCEKIFNGSKTIEVRKSRPSIDMPFKVYVYQTKHKGGKAIVSEVLNSVYGGGKVIGSFVCDRIDKYTFSNYEARYRINDVDIAKTCLTHPELIAYGKGKPLYGWHITEPKLFDKPKELGEFYRSLPEKVLENGEYDCRKEWDVLCIDAPEGGDYCAECPYGGRVQITRAPQSWVYCETIDER